MTDLTVTAHLDTPIIGEVNPLDAVLSWAAWQEAEHLGIEIPPVSDEHVHDFDLPLARWEQNGYWGWCTSAPTMDTVHYSSVEIRRRPPATPMAAFTTAREHHNGLGPLKARNTTLQATHHTTITWEVDCTDQDRLEKLLDTCTNLGARTRNGFGHVTLWEITPGTTGGWRNRPMPADTGTTMRVRAPYWHQTERTTCL